MNFSYWGEDVTDTLRDCASLELNDFKSMLHSDSFSLMESMSAIEVTISIQKYIPYNDSEWIYNT